MILKNPDIVKNRILLLKYLLIDICQYANFNSQIEKEKAILIDEGFIQHIFTNIVQNLHKTDFRKARWYLENAPLPDILIYLPTSPDICLQRMKNRGFPRRLRTQQIDMIRTLLSKGDEIFAFVYGSIEQMTRGMSKVYCLGNHPRREMARILSAHIKELR